MKISLCMIVKNEELHIERCLKSVLGIVDEIIIVDTGSTDQTISIALSMGASIIKFDWNHDFSAARNIGINQAKGDYILVLDADEELAPSSLISIQHAIRKKADGYIVEVENIHDELNSTCTLVRLFKNHPDYRWMYPIHEQIAEPIVNHGGKIIQSDIKIFHYGYTTSESKRKDRSGRNIALLESMLPQEQPYFMYQLAVEYAKLERFDDADRLYRRFFPKFTSKYLIYPEVVASYMINCNQLKQFHQCHELFDQNIDSCPDYLQMYSIDGKAFLEEGRYAEALIRFRTQLNVEPNPLYKSTVGIENFIPIYDIGVIYEKMGERQFALQCYQQSFSLKPNSQVFLSILELIGDAPDQIYQLIDDYSRFINFKDPNNLNTFLFQLLLKGKKSSFDKIRDRFKEVPIQDQLFNSLWTADFNLAISELGKLDTSRSKSVLAQIQNYISGNHLKPSDVELPIALGWTQLSNIVNRIEESDLLDVAHIVFMYQGLDFALPSYISLYQSEIYDELSLYRIGEALSQNGDIAAATEFYKRSYEYQPTSMNLFRLFEAAVRMNQFSTANSILHDGLDLFKESPLLIKANQLLKSV